MKTKAAKKKTTKRDGDRAPRHVERPLEELVDPCDPKERGRERILTAFALGDALGSRFETQEDEIHPAMKRRGGRSLSLFDGPTGPTAHPAGFTDDTVLTKAFAEHIIAFVRSTGGGIAQCPPFEGALYDAVIVNPSRGWGGSIKRASELRGPVISGGCGSMMRCAPLAFFAHSERMENPLWGAIAKHVASTHLGVEHVVWSWIYVMLLGDIMTLPRRMSSCVVRHRFRAQLTRLKNRVLDEFLIDDRTSTIRDWLRHPPKASVSNISVMGHSVFQTIEDLLADGSRVYTLNDVATECVLRGGDCDTRAALVCPFFAELDSEDFPRLEGFEELSKLELELSKNGLASS